MMAAFAAIERVQQLMSFHAADSDVSRINAAPVGREVSIERETYEVLRHAHELGHRSGGAFDVAIAPSLIAAGFLPSLGGALPEAVAGNDALAACFSDLELLSGGVVRWRKKGCIDLGGIAKGYAVDAAVTTLRSHGIAHGLVNAGGDLGCFGQPWPIHLRSPDQPDAFLDLGTLCDAAMATSAGYFCGRRVGSAWVDPIVDPARRSCVAWNASISVVARCCMVADALTKVVRLVPASMPALLDHYGAQSVVVDDVGLRKWGRNWLRNARPAGRLPRGEVAIG
jgi:FAD:protein FMN transferase